MIVGQNSVLNQYVPVFYIKNITDGQILVYNSTQKAFVNSDNTGGGSGGATKLGQLLDVNPSVDNPLSVQNGQALVYNSLTTIWENTFVDYNTLLNKPVIPTNNDFSFVGLDDTSNTPIPNGYVLWNSSATQLIYSATIPSSAVAGLATVATSGNYNDLSNKPTIGTVTSVAASGTQGITIAGSPITTAGTISIGLGAISPTSITTTGTVTAANFVGTSSGVNTGDQTITLTGDVTGSGTTSFATTLSTTGVAAGTYTLATITVDAKGRVISASSGPPGTGTVTSVAVTGGTTGLFTTGGPITTSGTITLNGTLSVANGGTGQTSITSAINALLPSQTGNNGKVLITDGTNISWATVSGTGTVTSVAASGSQGITISGSPITAAGTINIGLGAITPSSVSSTGTITGSNFTGSSTGTNTGDQTITLTGDVTGSGTGSFATTISNVNLNVGTFGSSTQVPQFTVNSKGQITAVSNVSITGGSSLTPEIVVFNYSSGSSGNFSGPGAIFSQTSGVTTTITDTTNCIATYAFTGKLNPPKSITCYGQAFATNTFTAKDTTSLPISTIAGGGTATSPSLLTSFGATNLVTLQTRMADTGASAGLGQRAWLIVIFGF